MPSNNLLATALLTSGLVVDFATAYTVISASGPFMFKNIDPIVYPGSYTKSHLHSFYGSDAVTANTNSSAELEKGCTNMKNPNDLSVYWTPTLLYQKGSSWEPVPLSRFSAYYSLGDNKADGPIPQNVKMVAGNTNAKTAAEQFPEANSEWFCEGGGGGDLDANGFPSSTCGTHLQQLLYFPNCVNEATLETAYKRGRPGAYYECPTGMRSMPQLRFSIRYDLRTALPQGWSGTAPIQLACGNAYCSHGDFIMGWTEDAAQNMVAATASKNTFAAVDGALGKNGVLPACTPADADPNNGVSTYAESVAILGTRAVDAIAKLVRRIPRGMIGSS